MWIDLVVSRHYLWRVDKTRTQEEEEIRELTARYEQAKQVIRNYWAYKKGFNFGSVAPVAPASSDVPETRRSAGRPRGINSVTQERHRVIIAEIKELPASTYTTAELEPVLSRLGISKGVLKTDLQKLKGSDPVYMVRAKSGRMPALYAKHPGVAMVSIDTPKDLLVANGTGANHDAYHGRPLRTEAGVGSTS